jgi:hypothetical protein
MPRSPRKPLAYLISAAAVSAGLGLAITPSALADDDTQPRSPDTGSSQCGNFLNDGPAGAGKIAACPLVDPKLNYQPPTDRAAPPPAPGTPGTHARKGHGSASDDSDSHDGDSHDSDSDDNDSNDD